MPKSSREIPRSELRRGVLTCLSVVALRLEEASTLLNRGFLTQAAVIFSFAVEEFGKAALLRAAFESLADPAVIDGFYDHQVKLAAAAKHIPAEHLLLTTPAFQPSAFQSDAFQVGSSADWEARLAGLYVDWRGGDWSYGVHVEPKVLEKSIDGVQAALMTAMVNWT